MSYTGLEPQLKDRGTSAHECFAGVLIGFEGGEGVGKSTQFRQLATHLEEEGFEVVCAREPGGTDLGEACRSLLLESADGAVCAQAELFLYEAARAQLMQQCIIPALEAGAVVLYDRFFDSTLAYQGFARGLDLGFVTEANRFATQGIYPDMTILLQGKDALWGLQRATKHDADRLEREPAAFHEAVCDGFIRIAQANPQRFKVIDAQGSIEEIAARIWVELDTFLKSLNMHRANDANLKG